MLRNVFAGDAILVNFAGFCICEFVVFVSLVREFVRFVNLLGLFSVL